MIRLLLLLCFLLAAVPAWADVAFDAVGGCQVTAAGSFSCPVTIGSGSNRLLLAAVVSNTKPAFPIANTLAWNTTETLSRYGDGDQSGREVTAWYLVNPTSGTHNLTGNLAGTMDAMICVLSFSGVSQSSPLGTVVQNNSTGASLSVTNSFTTGSMSAIFSVTGNSAATAGSGVTDRCSQLTNGTVRVVGGTSLQTTSTWTVNNSAWSSVNIEVLPDTITPQTFTSADCSLTNLQAAVNQTRHGDTVNVTTPGSATFISYLRVQKNINLNLTSCNITDNVTKGGAYASGIIWATASANVNTLWIHGFTLNGQATDPSVYNKGHVVIDGTSGGSAANVRVSNFTVNNSKTSVIRTYGYVWGVIDHCTVNSGNTDLFQGAHDTWGGGTYGDGSWAEANHLGTDKAWYVEDCTFTSNNNPFVTQVADSLDGARVVYRFNTLTQANFAEHGADTGGRRRGGRSKEEYANTLTFPAGMAVDFLSWFRGGTGVYWGNATTAPAGVNAVVKDANYRDTNTTAGWNQQSVTSITRSGSTATVTLAGNHNIGSGDVVLIAGANESQYNGRFSVTSTGATTFTYTVSGSPTTPATGTITAYGTGGKCGDASIYDGGNPGYRCVDQPGAGLSANLAGLNPPAAAAVGNALEPIYVWNNTIGGSANNCGTFGCGTTGNVVVNRDIYFGTASFTGATGVGSGTRAARPATCTTGVAYWSTDQGSWNAGSNVIYTGQGVLDLCTATNTWTNANYVPYTYPHPLVPGSGDVTAPSVSVTAPSVSATVTGTINVTATASDDVGVVGVQFKLDGANLGAEDTTSPYSVSWDSTGAANGSHALTAVARDAAGNSTTSTSVTVNVQNPAAPAAGPIGVLWLRVR